MPPFVLRYVGLLLAAFFTGLCFLLSGPAQSSEPALPLQILKDVPLPGSTGRLDYQSLDAQSHRLFVSGLGDGNVIVYNTERDSVVSVVPNVGRAHGVLAIPSLKRVFASATGSNEVVVIDESTLKAITRVRGGVYPDGIAYDPHSTRIFVSDEQGMTVTAVDVRSNSYLASIPLGGEVGNTQYDITSGLIVSIEQTHNRLVEIDPVSLRVLNAYSLPGCEGGHGLFIDSNHRLAFIACEDNATLVTVNLRTMKVISRASTGESPDVLAFDAGLRRLYVASESGVVSAFDEVGDSIKKVGESYIGYKAHSVAVDSLTHRVYFPLQEVNGHPVMRVMLPTHA